MYVQVKYSWMGRKVYRQSINLHLKLFFPTSRRKLKCVKFTGREKDRHEETQWTKFNLQFRRAKTIHLIFMGHPRTCLPCYSTWRVATTPANIHFIFRIWNTLLLWKQRINSLQAQRKTWKNYLTYFLAVINLRNLFCIKFCNRKH